MRTPAPLSGIPSPGYSRCPTRTTSAARAATRASPEPQLLGLQGPDKFGWWPCHKGNGRAATSVEKAHGNYDHWLWPMFPKQNVEAGCQTCHSADMVLVSGDTGWTI